MYLLLSGNHLHRFHFFAQEAHFTVTFDILRLHTFNDLHQDVRQSLKCTLIPEEVGASVESSQVALS